MKSTKAGKAGERHIWLDAEHKFNRLHAAILIIAVAAAALLANQYYSPEFPGEELSPYQTDPTMCGVAADCVPAECCHPVSCINRDNAPNCGGIICTMLCDPGTMDCGYGSCSCVEGKCTAVMAG